MATETVTVFDAAGVKIEQTQVEIPAVESNRRTLHAQAEAALAANRTYLALASPTNAQNAAQLRALTQQMQRVIRIVTAQFDAVD